ncbi:hypothetical protein [Microbacterium oxydans]|uniref:hypothetical protein n=1 Tax=Microbacterium oxydans TaxID=82380 RepID=UPI0024ACD2C1|nr:hypothetical protein [Microbacterium oxydans]
MSDTAWEPHYRWWVCEKNSGAGWTVVRKCRWRFVARSVARSKTRQGFRMKVEDRG